MKFRLTLLLIIPIILSGCLEVVQPETKIQTFDITSFNTQNNNITIVLRINGTELISSDPTLSFDIWPETQNGTTAKDHATIYFSADDFNTQLFKFNGAYQIKWSIDGNTFYVSGSKTMSFMKHYTLTLQFGFNLYEITKNTLSNLTLNFHNKENTWIKSYNVNFIVVDV
jgi:hypothetical protein